MGQYYMPTSLDKMESVYSHNYGNGLKLMEHSWIGNEFVGVVEKLISKGGRWFGDRIVWAGDYADPEKNENGEESQNIFSMVHENNIKPDVKENSKFGFLKNLDTNEFVVLSKVPVSELYEGFKWRIHPLPLLTCEGNGRGGGDYHQESPLIGKWARNRVVMQKHRPKSGTELIFDLVE